MSACYNTGWSSRSLNELPPAFSRVRECGHVSSARGHKGNQPRQTRGSEKKWVRLQRTCGEGRHSFGLLNPSITAQQPPAYAQSWLVWQWSHTPFCCLSLQSGTDQQAFIQPWYDNNVPVIISDGTISLIVAKHQVGSRFWLNKVEVMECLNRNNCRFSLYFCETSYRILRRPHAGFSFLCNFYSFFKNLER